MKRLQLFLIWLTCICTVSSLPGQAPDATAEIKTAEDLVRVRTLHDQTIWSKEVLAQRHENAFVKLWDNLLRNPDKYAVLRDFAFDSVTLAEKEEVHELDWGITRRTFSAPSRELPRDAARQLLDSFQKQGYSIVESEWHHSKFQPATVSSAARSTVSCLLHVLHAEDERRLILKGEVGVEWEPQPAAEFPKRVAKLDLSAIQILSRQGPTAFAPQFVQEFKVDSTGKRPASIHPVIVHDLNHDGLPELVVGGFNRVYWNRGNWKFEDAPLCELPRPHVRAAVLGDFDGDGREDYLCFPLGSQPYLFHGEPGGRFPSPGQTTGFKQRLPKPSSVTAGDIDGDGDLDVFVGQQKSSYSSGFVPAPFYDANDGFRSYLLKNDGNGNFQDITAIAGLGRKNRRHVFSSTFVDLDDDGDLDLLLTNDFCGCDLFLNDGQGVFTDASESLAPTRHAFGMSHSFGDYDLDGRLDFIMIGMSSTTARRLEQLGLRREDLKGYDAKRPEMGYGNRLFLNRDGRFEQSSTNATVARTGWSWGSTTLDFDSDGDQDIYVVNGQISGKTTQDYCTRFWCHDLYYTADDGPQAAIKDLFSKFAPVFSGQTISWNGYEHNALLMNLDGERFVNVGFLMGVAFEFDARTAISADLDGDGRVDLLVEQKDVRNNQRNLYVLRNTWSQQNHWIGVHLIPSSGTSTHGAKITATLPDGRQLVQHCLSGHSVWAQHPSSVHFGLGQLKHVRQLSVRWPSGEDTVLADPKPDRYYVVSPGD